MTPEEVQKRAIFTQEFKSVVETKSIFAPIATKIIATVKYIYSPFTGVSAAKNHTQACRVPVGEATVGVDEMVLDRYTGNAIKDCEEEMSFANFDLTGMRRRDLYASVIKKLNQNALADFLADATTVAGTVDLSTPQKVQNFLIGVAADAESESVGVQTKIDGGTVKRAEYHDKPFVLAGRDAYVQITSAVASLVSQSSTQGMNDGKMMLTPYGVLVINLAGTGADAKQLIYGTGGVPVMAYREDKVEVDMGEIVSNFTYAESSPDLDIEEGDEMIEKKWYISAQTRGKNGIFENVASLVKEQKMA